MTTSKRSLHGRSAYIDVRDRVGGRLGVLSGGIDRPTIVYPSAEYTSVFDDFYVSGNDTGYAGANFKYSAADTGAAGAVVAGTNGIYRLTPTETPTSTVAGSVSVVTGEQLQWKVNQGEELRFATRLKKSTYSGGEHGLFVGFTDSTAAEMPVHDTGGTADKATATNAFGIGWNLSGDTGWVGYAVDGDTVQEDVLVATTPTDNVYVELEVVATRTASDTGGSVSFFVDGLPKGQIDNPCNASTALTPVVAVYDTGGAATVDVDWIAVSAQRDTGT